MKSSSLLLVLVPTQLLAVLTPLYAGPVDIWYGPNPLLPGAKIRTDFFSNVSDTAQSWPLLSKDVSTFKIFLDMLYGPPGAEGLSPGVGSTDEDLKSLIAALRTRGIRTGIEIGGTAWSTPFCTLEETMKYVSIEQRWVSRWLKLGGSIDSLTTDHADVKNVRRGKTHGRIACDPAVPMATRIEVVAQVFKSWRNFLGPRTSLGFIESLGFWDIEGPDGTNFTNTDPTSLDHIPGWIPSLEDVTSMLLNAAQRHNPVPEVPLIDHYFIDFGLEGVEYDTRTYGSPRGGGLNYGRVLGAEAIMHRHGLKTGIFLNAFHDRTLLNCSAHSALGPGGCSASAASRTINYTRGYMELQGRMSEHAVLEQWQPFPSVTGPETIKNTGMWMALQCSKTIKGTGTNR